MRSGESRPTKVFERAGESRMTPPASSISSQVGGQVGADGEVFGVFEEALAGGILPQAVGEAGHGVEPAPVDGEGAHAMEGRGLAIDGAGGRPGGAPGELVLTDLIGGQRGGPRVAAVRRDSLRQLDGRAGSFVGHRDAPLGQEIFDIANAHTEAVIQPDGVTDGRGGKSISMVARRVALHRRSLPRAH